MQTHKQQFLCLKSWAPLRAGASSKTEMTSSLLFGETCTLLNKEDDWFQVRCNEDHYSGWIPALYLEDATSYLGFKWNVVDEIGARMQGKQGDEILLSPGSLIPDAKKLEILGSIYHYQPGKKLPAKPHEIAQAFLNTPYLWGGRSFWGIDCSGLIQVVGKLLKLSMPRDAHEQATMGIKKMWNQIASGDLVYFSNSDGRVVHVGICMGHGQILHAHAHVRIDTLSAQGIVNAHTGEITHTLCDIRSWQ